MADSEQTQPEITETNYKYNPSYHRVSDYVGIDKYEKQDSKTANKIAFIYDWAGKKANSKDTSEVINQIAKTIKGLGVSFRGKTLVNYLYQNMRLADDTKRLQTKRKPSAKRVRRTTKAPNIKAQVNKKIKKVKTNVKDYVKKEVDGAISQGIKEALKGIRL